MSLHGRKCLLSIFPPVWIFDVPFLYLSELRISGQFWHPRWRVGKVPTLGIRNRESSVHSVPSLVLTTDKACSMKSNVLKDKWKSQTDKVTGCRFYVPKIQCSSTFRDCSVRSERFLPFQRFFGWARLIPRSRALLKSRSNEDQSNLCWFGACPILLHLPYRSATPKMYENHCIILQKNE